MYEIVDHICITHLELIFIQYILSIEYSIQTHKKRIIMHPHTTSNEGDVYKGVIVTKLNNGLSMGVD